MKKLFAVCICASLSFCLSGCTLGTILEQFTSTGDTSVQETPVPSDNTVSEIKDRVYMDEISVHAFPEKHAPSFRVCLMN